MKKFLSVLLAVMMVLSTVSFAAPSLAGVADSAVEAPVVEVPAEETADLAAGITDNTDHGELVFELNFDNLANGTTVANNAKLNTLGATLSSNIAKANDLYLVLSGYGSAVVENGALKAVKTGTGRWPQIQVSVGNKNSLVDNGIIYMEADMKVDRTAAQTCTVNFSLTGYREYLDGTSDAGSNAQTSVQTIYTVEDETWYSLKGAYALNDSDGINGLECVIFLPTYSASSSETDYYYIDNLRLYYKPFTVDVTVKAGDKTVKKTVSTLESVSIASLAEELDLGVLYSVTGAKVDDKTYSYSDSLTFSKDSTVELTVQKVDDKYIHSEYGLMIFDIDLENHNIGDDVAASDGSFNVGSYVTPIGEKVMSHPASNWHFNESGYDIKVYADPTNANNKVLGVIGATSTGYPCLMLTTYSNSASARYGWIEDNDLIWTVTADIYDTTNDGVTLRFGGRSSVSENEGLAKWTTVEDTPTEGAITNKAASTWYTYKGTMLDANYSRMCGSDELSFIKFHSASPTNADLYWDNIKLYYRPAHVDVTFADCDIDGVTIANKNLTDVATAGLTVSSLLSMAGVDYSAVSSLSYTFKGIAIDGVEYGLNDTLGLLEDTTVSLVFEEVDMSEWTDEKGLLLFDIDFEDAKAAEVITASTGSKDYLLNSFNAKVNPYVEGTDKWALSLSGMNGIGIENGALKFQWDGTGKWPQILVGIPNNSSGLSLMGENGSYYVHAEYKILDSVDSNLTSIAVQSNGFKDGVHQGPGGILPMGNDYYASRGDLVANSWFTIEGGSKSTWTNDTDGLDNDDISKITTVFTHSATTGTPGGVYLMDNIKLYWKPAKVNVTIEGGKNENFETVTLKNVSTSATIAEVIAMIPGSTTDFGKITGLADENGVKLTDLGLISDTTYQALWSPWVVLEGGQEFPVDEKGCTKTQWSGAYGQTCEVGNGDPDVTGAVSWMWGNGWYSENGNMYRVQDTVAIGENNGSLGTSATWSTPAVHGHEKNGLIRDNIKTNLPAGNDAEYVLVKYRYTNLPDLADVVANDPNPDGKKYSLSANGEELTYYDRNGDTKVFDMSPAYGAKYYIQRQNNDYSYGGGEEFHKDELFVEGEWLYDFLPFVEVMNTDGVKLVLVQRYNLFDQMVTEYDYVRFVKLGEELDPVVPEQPATEASAPTTDTEKASIRVDSPMGLRFRATLDKATADDASDYGWVVARKTVVENAGFALTDVTVDQEAFKVVVGYGRKDGDNLKNFFEETDELKTFTAVVYNLPAGMEQDVLVARPFVKVGGEYMYGEPAAKSIYEVACAIRDGGYDGLTEYQQGKINAIIAAVA